VDISHLLADTEWQSWLADFRNNPSFDQHFTMLMVTINQLQARCQTLENNTAQLELDCAHHEDRAKFYMRVIDAVHTGLEQRNEQDQLNSEQHAEAIDQLQAKTLELETALATVGTNLDLLRLERDSYLQEIQVLSDERDMARDGYGNLLDDTTGEINHLRFEIDRLLDEHNNMQLKHAEQMLGFINSIAQLNQQIQKAKDFFAEIEIGHGNDPVGFLVASHRYMAVERNRYQEKLKKAIAFIDQLVTMDVSESIRSEQLTEQAKSILSTIQQFEI
jgi:hypothetical protein